MKRSLLVVITILSVSINLNKACAASSGTRTKPTTSPKRPTGLFPFRIYGYIKKGKAVRVSCSSLPGVCLTDCKATQYVIGKYRCPGYTMCCVDRSFVPKPAVPKTKNLTRIAQRNNTDAPINSTHIPTNSSLLKAGLNSTHIPTNSSLLKAVVNAETTPTTRRRTVTTENGVASNVPTQKPSSKPPAARIFGFIPKQPKTTKTCKGDFNGVCRGECHNDEYVEGRFDCTRPENCCVKR